MLVNPPSATIASGKEEFLNKMIRFDFGYLTLEPQLTTTIGT